ncbi:hypothetical protein HOY82DRAFT_647061 [Tuber indicum]|nr:hypothetical protein HOY82DRAFT_647061 [Tuber indicum]
MDTRTSALLFSSERTALGLVRSRGAGRNSSVQSTPIQKLLAKAIHTSLWLTTFDDLVTDDLVQLREIYANEHQSTVGAPTWVVDCLLEAGIPAEIILRILDEMYWRDKVPFQGTVGRRLVSDMAYVAEKWLTHAVRRGGEALAKKEFVRGGLTGLSSIT